MNKILSDTKKMLGIPVSEFDDQLVIHINSVLMTLNQIGVGTSEYVTTIDTGDLDEFLLAEEALQNKVQAYIYAKVRLLFDPPTIASVLLSLENQVKEMEWRLMDASA